MKREFHVRFWEGGGVRFPSATRPGEVGRIVAVTPYINGEMDYEGESPLVSERVLRLPGRPESLTQMLCRPRARTMAPLCDAH